MHGSEPPEYATSADQPAFHPAYGVDTSLPLVEIPLDEGIEAANINAYAYVFHVAAFERIGGFHAWEVLARRFCCGDVRIATGELLTRVCERIERERLRDWTGDRDRVLRRVFDDPRRDGYIARLSDACIALELSVRPGYTSAPLRVPAARFIVAAGMLDFQRHLSDEGAGAVSLVAKHATADMTECINILDHEDIGACVQGGDVFDRIAWLMPGGTDRPTVQDARQTMRLGSVGRQLMLESAKHVGQVDTIADGEWKTICELAMDYQFTNGSIGMDDDDMAGRGRRAVNEAADEHGRKVIYFRGRASA